jgi:hypothetical protein
MHSNEPVPSGIRRFAYGTDDNLLAEFDGSNERRAVHTFAPGLDAPLASHRAARPRICSRRARQRERGDRRGGRRR